ncbi:hypothetical protein BASA61_001281, partial [Batrachochytrium salamandrivorans]
MKTDFEATVGISSTGFLDTEIEIILKSLNKLRSISESTAELEVPSHDSGSGMLISARYP